MCSTDAASSTARRACRSSTSQPPTRRLSSATCIRSRITCSCRKFSPTNSWRLRPSISLRRGISAVCGIGRPSGCLNSAVTANQSAIAPTIDASAPALTKPRKPSWSSVTTYTAAANSSRPTASERIRRRPRRRSSSSSGAAVIIGTLIDDERTGRTRPDQGSPGQRRWRGDRVVPDEQGGPQTGYDGDGDRGADRVADRVGLPRPQRPAGAEPHRVQHERAVVLHVDHPGGGVEVGGQRDLVRPQDDVDVHVGVRPARHRRDHADLAGQQGVLHVRGQEVGVPHERRHEAAWRAPRTPPAGCRPARSRRRASPPRGRRWRAPRSGRG